MMMLVVVDDWLQRACGLIKVAAAKRERSERVVQLLLRPASCGVV